MIATTTPAERERHALQQRAQRLLESEVAFISSPEFHEPGAEKRILGDSDPHMEFEQLDGDAARALREMPGHLARLCEAPLLTVEAERSLFRRMNYCKFRANAVRPKLERRNASKRWVEEGEYWLAEAEATRNRILCSNLRLPISMVKKMATSMITFDELLSEAFVSLMHAVEKFDYQRGYRFSTYAYRAISRHAYRVIAEHTQRNSRFQPRAEWLETETPIARTEPVSESRWSRLNAAMRKLLLTLNDRERKIVECRFALGDDREPRTFQSLADELGVSKERVRQIEKRAVEKLQQRAAETVDQDVALAAANV